MLGGYAIAPTEIHEIEEVGRFLFDGFRDPSELYFSAELLRWKYFEPCGVDIGPRSLVARAAGRIVGHLGLVPREIRSTAGVASTVWHNAVHLIDLLGSPSHPMAGLLLMKRAFRIVPIQYSIGGSEDGRRIALATGYAPRAEVAVMRAVLRPSYRLGQPGHTLLGRLARMTRDAAKALAHHPRRPQKELSIERVTRFGEEVGDLLTSYSEPLTMTNRTSELLNYYLKYPGAGKAGFVLRTGQRLVGIALLTVVDHGDGRVGRIADCFIASRDEWLWHAALNKLRRELKGLGAQVASYYASTPWAERAAQLAGFTLYKRTPVYVRDSERRLNPDQELHLTGLEGDHAIL